MTSTANTTLTIPVYVQWRWRPRPFRGYFTTLFGHQLDATGWTPRSARRGATRLQDRYLTLGGLR